MQLPILLLLSVALMGLDHQTNQGVRLRQALSIVVAPIQYVVDTPVNILSWLSQSFSTHQALLADNANLQAQNVLLNAKLQQFQTLEKENNQLRALLQSQPRQNVKVSVGQLLAVSNSPYIQQVTIDKGSSDKVFEGQPVIDATGVMGQVIHVGLFTSQVMLLTDRRSDIPVMNSRTGMRAILGGTGNPGELNLLNVPQTVVNTLKVGDVFLSSGLGGLYPAGYPVGQIQSIQTSPNDEFASITLTPNARLTQSRVVLLIWPSENQTESREPKA